MKNAQKVWCRSVALGAAGLMLVGCGTNSENGPNFGALYRAAQERRNTPQPVATVAATPVAFIDVAAIAARHPSWRLANAIENRTRKSLSFSGLDAPAAPQPVALSSEPLEREAAGLPRTAQDEELSAPVGDVAGYNRPPQRLTARDAGTLENTARSRQENSLTDFLNDVSERQEATRDDQRALWRMELEDEIEGAQRLSLAGLTPILPPPEVQLEMTNLRLALGEMDVAYENSKSLDGALRARALEQLEKLNPARRQAAARLRSLEIEWREKLRAQENARLEELKVLQFEMPAKMRQEGTTRLEQRVQTLARRDATQRAGVSDALRERISAGFTSDGDGPHGTLSILLPPARLAPQSIEGAQSSALAYVRNGGAQDGITHQIHNGIISTQAVISTSAGEFAGATTSSAPPARAYETAPRALNRAQILRRQAWQESQRWAQAVARRRGWKLQTRRTANTPDRTREALRLLNLS